MQQMGIEMNFAKSFCKLICLMKQQPAEPCNDDDDADRGDDVSFLFFTEKKRKRMISSTFCAAVVVVFGFSGATTFHERKRLQRQ